MADQQEDPQNRNPSIVVIGAGYSGLSAAKLLHENSDANVIVLEARDRVGGRTFTKRDPKIKWVDLGGAYVGPTQDRLLRLAKEYGVKTYLVNDVEPTLHYRQGRRLRLPKESLCGSWNPFAIMDTNNLLRKVDEIGDTIPLDAPWTAPNAEALDKISTESYAQSICWTKYARDFWRMFLSLNVCCETYEASMLWFCWYVKACGGVNRIISTTNGGQERKFDGGSQQIPESMARDLGDRVKLKSPVAEIETVGKTVKIRTTKGDVYEADYVILAIPPILQMKIHFIPDLPPKRNQMIQRIPMGSVMKVMAYYTTPFWRKHDINGTMLMVDPESDFAVKFTLDDTKPDGSCACIMGFIAADVAIDLCKMDKESRMKAVTEGYAIASGLDEFRRPIHYEEHNWGAEQYSGGCYVGHFPPGCLTSFGPELRKPYGKIYFAGTETATQWSGYMEGAIQAGERAAREIMCDLGLISVSEIWVKEPPSKDVIPREFKTGNCHKYMPSISSFLQLSTVSTIFVATASWLVFYCKQRV